MAAKIFWKIVHVIVVVCVISIRGKQILCKTRFKTDVICEPGSNDYILKRGLVSDNNATIAITLKGCLITEVDYEAFENDFNLKQIDLSRNKISELKLGVLDGIKKLTSLRLSHNMLTTFPLGLFDQLPKLERLDLSDNNINSLELGIFDTLPKLLLLDLSGNDLLGKDLSPFIFDQNPKIVFMHFSRNDMSGSPEKLLNAFRTLEILGLNNCSLTEVPKFATRLNLKTMKNLQLQTNQITKIDPTTLANLVNLETLDLTGNRIDIINISAFRQLTKLESLDLSFNKIEEIPENFFENLPRLDSIDLSYNLIDVVPVNLFRRSAVTTLNLEANRISFLDSNFFLELRNSRSKLSSFFFNDNPFQCACLLEIIKEVKKFRIKYNSDKYDGEHAVCSVTNEFTCIRDRSRILEF